MVRELISLQVGQAGNQIGTAFWDALRQEHGICADGKSTKFRAEGEDAPESVSSEQVVSPEDALCRYSQVFFKETASKDDPTCKYVPRALLVDLEPGTIDSIKSGPLGNMFHPANMIAGSAGAGNNWAKGHYTEGAEMVDEVLDRMRKEAEYCDCLQGFQLMHSLGGGTGSGMGTLLLLKIRDSFPDRVSSTYTVFPSPSVSETVVEPYNATLASHVLLENTDTSFILDNEALREISSEVLKLKEVSFRTFNDLISRVMLGITSSLRFPGSSNMDLRKLAVNLVPFPRLHFFQLAEAPIYHKHSSDRTNLNAKEVVRQCFSGKNFFSKVNPNEGKYLAASFIFRGKIPEKDIDEQIVKLQTQSAEDFVEWIPNNLKSALVHMPPTHARISSTFISNTTSMKSLFIRLNVHFSKLFKRRAFLHWYTEEGMDEMEFQEADKNLRDLVMEYQDKENAVYDKHESDAAESEEDY